MDKQTIVGTLREQINDNHHDILFEDVIQVVDSLYEFSACGFHNGELYNEAGENQGSAKWLGFGKLHELTERELLSGFGQYYREVLDDPEGEGHQNIRQFMKNGWAGVSFDAEPLKLR